MAVAFSYVPPKVNGIAAIAAAAKAGELAGAAVLLAASQPLVPVAPAGHRTVVGGGVMVLIEPGTLRDSGHVEDTAEGAAVVYSAVAPDGYNYAAIQHEDLNFHHEQGENKYLERPMHTDHEAIIAAAAAPVAAVLH